MSDVIEVPEVTIEAPRAFVGIGVSKARLDVALRPTVEGADNTWRTPNTDDGIVALVERWFALMKSRRLTRGAFRSTHALEQAIKGYIAVTNTDPKPFVWTKTADEMLGPVARYCQRSTDSHHYTALLNRSNCSLNSAHPVSQNH